MISAIKRIWWKYFKILNNRIFMTKLFAILNFSSFIVFKRANPYQKVIQILGKTLEPFTEYGHVYAYGFGDAVSQDFDVFNLLSGINDNDVWDINKPCSDFRQGKLCLNDVMR